MAFLKRKDSSPQQDIQDCLRKRDFKGAVAAFEHLLKGNPKEGSQMRMRYADTLVLAGRKRDAVIHYRQVAEEMAESGFLVRAIAIYKKIVKLDPSQSDVVEHLARLDSERAGTRVAPRAGAAAESAVIAEDSDDDGGMELDIGAGLTIGMEAAEPDPPPAFQSAPARTARPAAAPTPMVEDDLPADLDIDAIGDLAMGEIPSGLDAGADFDPNLLAPDDLDDDAGLPAPDEEEVVAAPPEPHRSKPQTEPATAAPAVTGLGFDFGFGSPVAPAAPAALPTAAAATAGLGLSFDFGLESEVPSEPVAPPAAMPASDHGFDFGAGDQGGAPTETEASDDLSPPSPSFGDESPLGDLFAGSDQASGAGEDLLGLLGDDIDSMIDGIMGDVDADAQGLAPVDMGRVDTNIELFSHLAIDEFVEVLKLLERTTCKANEVIVREGDPGTSMFIISSGAVTASVVKEGRPVPIASLADGDFFGEMAVLSGAPRAATVTAGKLTELLVLERDRLLEIFSRFPEIEAKIRLAHDERAEKLKAMQQRG